MTLTIQLTADQEQLLRREALNRGVDTDLLAQQLLERALSDIGGDIAPLSRTRVLGLHAGQVGIADDFDAPEVEAPETPADWSPTGKLPDC